MPDNLTPAPSASQALPALSLPTPATTVGRAIAPVIQASVLWYLAAVVDQQNRINQLIAAELERLSNSNTELRQVADQVRARLDVAEALQSDLLEAIARDRADAAQT